MGRPSFREKLLTSGVQTIRRRGFGTVGVRELTASAGVAQGSFTNHFSSKEAFGVAVLDQYAAENLELIAATVGDSSQDPVLRLYAYFDSAIEYFSGVGWRYGCLAGNMALDTSEHSEAIRTHLSGLFSLWASAFAQAIKDAQSRGMIRRELDAEQAASAVLEAWHGAMLRMKLDRTPDALYRFKRRTLLALLA